MAAQGARVPERGVRLLLGNLSYDVTEANISQALQGCAGVLYVGIRRAPDTQRSRGHGYVDFANEECALRAFERLQSLEIKGRSVRVDWCEQPLRRKYTATADQPGGLLRDGAVEGGLPVVELFDSKGCLTPAALLAAEAVTLGDLEQILEELRLLLPSTGSLLQQLLQEGPMLRSALLQAELLLGRLDGIDLRAVGPDALKRAEAGATRRLLLECRALRPPALSALADTSPLTDALRTPSSSVSTSSLRQKKPDAATRRPATRRPSAPAAPVVHTAEPPTAANSAPAIPSWRVSPAPDTQAGTLGQVALSPLTPEPTPPAYGDRREGTVDGGTFSFNAGRLKRKMEDHEQEQATQAAEATGAAEATQPVFTTTADANSAGMAPRAPAIPARSDAPAWLAAEEARAALAPDSLVDELLRSPGLLEKVVQMTPADLIQLDQQQRQQVMSLRKALRARGRLLPSSS